MQMEFGPLEIIDPIWTIDVIAHKLILLAIFVFVFHVITMFILYRKLRRWAEVLGAPLRIYIERGIWEPAEISSWPEIKNPKFLAVVGALRQELPGCGPLSALTAINQGMDLLTGPFIRMIHRIQAFGWGICLIGLFSGMVAVQHVFLASASFTDKETSTKLFGILSRGLVWAIEEPIFGLAVGIAFLAVSVIARSLLGFIRQDLSNRILAAAAQFANLEDRR